MIILQSLLQGDHCFRRDLTVHWKHGRNIEIRYAQKHPVFIKTCCNGSGRFISNNTALRPKAHDESVMLLLVSDVFGNASGEVKHTVLAVCELRIVTYHVTYSFRCASALPACKSLKRVWKIHVPVRRLERVKGFEPSTPTLARLCSTPELHPRSRCQPSHKHMPKAFNKLKSLIYDSGQKFFCQ
jgi:hypothetical protein